MKKSILLIAVIALVGTVTLTLNSLRAQNEAAPAIPAAPPAGQNPPPQGPGPRPYPPGMRGRMGQPNYRMLAITLRRVKAQLENSKDDYDGHRQSAIDACDKAAQELEAVQKSIQAAAAAKAAAAKAAAEQQAPANSTPAPAPATPPQ